MSATHGSPHPDPPVSAQVADMPSAAAVIRTGSLLSSSQSSDGIGLNFNVSTQVNGEKESVPLPQRVLGEAFCVNRLAQIRKLAGNERLMEEGFDRDPQEKEITHLFRRFLRDNGKKNPPYFCVSAAILGRLIHTFKEEHISNDKKRKTSSELGLYVDEIMEKAKESMEQDATAIRMQTQNCIDRQHKLIADAHARCEATLKVAHSRMREASKACEDAFAEALNQQLQTVLASTIIEDTLNQEMGVAAQAHRNGIDKMTAIPPLVMDENRLQLQIKCAKAEEEVEDLRLELKALKEKDAE
jgi:hypothetical protein